jgi:hypothetical protein
MPVAAGRCRTPAGRSIHSGEVRSLRLAEVEALLASDALESLLAAGQVRAVGAGRSRRWTSPPLVGFTTTLLLPGPPLPG